MALSTWTAPTFILVPFDERNLLIDLIFIHGFLHICWLARSSKLQRRWKARHDSPKARILLRRWGENGTKIYFNLFTSGLSCAALLSSTDHLLSRMPGRLREQIKELFPWASAYRRRNPLCVGRLRILRCSRVSRNECKGMSYGRNHHQYCIESKASQ